MLLHLQTKEPCIPVFEGDMWKGMKCASTWSLISLPLVEMPWQRKMKMKEGWTVPVFPSAFEQLRGVLNWDGAVNAFEFVEGLSRFENLPV